MFVDLFGGFHDRAKCFMFAAGMTLSIAIVAAAPAGAVTVGFERITSNSPADASGQLSVDVTDGVDGALFDFLVSAGPNPGANVAEVYFDDRTPLFIPPPQIVSQIGATFTDDGSANPGNLPGANNASPPFVTTNLLKSEAAGNSATGLTIGDTLILKLVYAGGFVFADVLAALDDGSLRIGLHVRSLLDGESDAFVNTPPTVIPIPAALPLFGTALLGMGFLSRRRRKVRAAA